MVLDYPLVLVTYILLSSASIASYINVLSRGRIRLLLVRFVGTNLLRTS